MTTQTTTHKENNMTKYYIYKYSKLIKETYVFKDIIPYIKKGYLVRARNKLKS